MQKKKINKQTNKKRRNRRNNVDLTETKKCYSVARVRVASGMYFCYISLVSPANLYH